MMASMETCECVIVGSKIACAGGSLARRLASLILFSPGDAFLDQSLIVASPFVVLIGTGGHRRFTAF